MTIANGILDMSALVEIGVSPSPATVFIAASNAPAAVKARASVVCDGVNDAAIIQAVIDGFPVLPNFERSKVLVVGGKTGSIQLSEGKFNLSSALIVPAGSVIRIKGMGVTSWRPIDPVGNQYEGGTLLYSIDPGGKILQYPQYTGNRTDTGVSNTIPASGVFLEDIEMRVLNPLTTQNNAALMLDGWTTGVVRNINVFADITTNATRRINRGVQVMAGARSDRKILHGVHSFYFRDVGFQIGTTHLDALQLVAGAIGDGTSPTAFQITPDQNCHFDNLHAFSCQIGLKVNGSRALEIGSMMFETLTTPVLFQTTRGPMRIVSGIFNTDVNWVGDIADYCDVDFLQRDPSFLLRTRNTGMATIPSGESSVSVPHSLVADPTRLKSFSPTSAAAAAAMAGVGVYMTSDNMNITLTLATGTAASALTFSWEARAA